MLPRSGQPEEGRPPPGMARAGFDHRAHDLLHPDQAVYARGGLPFELEPYRSSSRSCCSRGSCRCSSTLAFGCVRAGLGLPLSLFVAGALGSVIVNSDRIHALALEGHVFKQLMFFLTFILMLLLIVSVLRTAGDVDRMLRVLVLGGPSSR